MLQHKKDGDNVVDIFCKRGMRGCLLVLCFCVALSVATHYEAKAHPRLQHLFSQDKEVSFMIHFDRALLPTNNVRNKPR